MKRSWFDGTPCTFVWIKSSSFTARLSFPPSTFDFLRRQHLVVRSVTRAFYEIFDFFLWNFGNKLWKWPKFYNEKLNLYKKVHFIEFLLMNVLDKNLRKFPQLWKIWSHLKGDQNSEPVPSFHESPWLWIPIFVNSPRVVHVGRTRR